MLMHETPYHCDENFADLDFDAEISEFYSDAEFEELLVLGQEPTAVSWRDLGHREARLEWVHTQLSNSEKCDADGKLGVVRAAAARSLHYVALGCFRECGTTADLRTNFRDCHSVLLEAGVLDRALLEVFREAALFRDDPAGGPVPSRAANAPIRHWAGIAYAMIEWARHSSDIYPAAAAEVHAELMRFEYDGVGVVESFLGLLHYFVDSSMYILPAKKLLLLCWKSTICMYGGLDAVEQKKIELRRAAGLPVRPPVPAEILSPEDELVESRGARMKRFVEEGRGMGLTVADESASSDGDATETEEDLNATNFTDSSDELTETEDNGECGDADSELLSPPANSTADPVPRQISEPGRVEAKETNRVDNEAKGSLKNLRSGRPRLGKRVNLQPKTSPQFLEMFRDSLEARPLTSMWYDAASDSFRQPAAIEEAVATLEANMYVSLRHHQAEEERKRQETRLAHGHGYVAPESTRTGPVEVLFRNTVQCWSDHSINLIKLLFAATSLQGSRSGGSINFDGELDRPGATDQSATPMHAAEMHRDYVRHGEIIIKAVSALLLLLMKHFNLNHTYQMEYIGVKLVHAKGIAVALKALNQADLRTYFTGCEGVDISDNFLSKLQRGGVESASTVSDGESAEPKLTEGEGADDTKPPSEQVTCRRNLQGTISLLRLLQKFTKNKHYRVVQLVQSKSVEIIKPLLRVQHSLVQLYALKLIKSQVPYFAKQWKKNNSRIMSAIDLKVRHRILDTWFYSQMDDAAEAVNDDEEFLRDAVSRFVQDYYPQEPDTLCDVLQAASIFDILKPEIVL